MELKAKLERHGYQFYSETDTEVVIKLIDYYYKKYQFGPVDAINRTLVRIRGSYALALMFRDHPGEIYAARRDAPMILGVTDDSCCLASDVPAILQYTRTVYYIGNMEIARLLPGEVHFFDLNGDEIEILPTEITWDAKAAEKNGYEHFMIKEIHEQPEAVRDTLSSLITDGRIDLSSAGLTDDMLRTVSSVRITACGSAWHTGMAAQYILEDMAALPTRVELASEYRYRRVLPEDQELCIVISQSGETADSLAALRKAKGMGIRTLAIVNVVGSTIAHEADHVLYTHAGPEIAVATTKAYSAQLIVLYALTVQLAYVRGEITQEQYAGYLNELGTIPDKISRILEEKERIQWFAAKFAGAKDIFFLGRGLDYAISLEGSLKAKEISYVHSEAYAAGEMKHGTISLIEDNTLVIGALTQNTLFEKTVSNMAECKARGAYLMALTCYGNYSVEDVADFTVYIPKTDPCFMTSLAVVPLQLFGYYSGVARGLDVDKPRNLAKSVTVE